MTSPNFPHPNDPTRTPLFPDLYFQYHDLMKLRSDLRREMCEALELSAGFEPRLPAALQAALEQIEAEAHTARAALNDADAHSVAMHDLDRRRSEIFQIADQLGTKAWQGTTTDAPAPDACRVRLRYCEHCLGQLRARINALRAGTSLRDPFALLDEKFDLTDDELEILIHLYHRQFERPEPVTGAALLGEVIGRQSAMFRAQSLMFDTAPLLANGLLAVIRRGCGTLDTTFALSRTANLIISGLHIDYPLQDVRWTETTGRPSAGAGERGLNLDGAH